MKYELLKYYPGVSHSLKIGDTVEKRKDGIWHGKDFYNSDWNDEHFSNYPEFWKLIQEKDYEILSFITINRRFPVIKNNDYESFYLRNSNTFAIHSVKRLSDGEVFTVGDKIHSFRSNKLIKRFQIVKTNILRIITTRIDNCPKNQEGIQYLDEISKAQEPLFTTEDGVDIYEGDSYYTVFSDWTINTKDKAEKGIDFKGSLKDFSTKTAAEEYILMNKACLSLHEFFSLIAESKFSVAAGFLKEMKKHVQTKLNQ